MNTSISEEQNAVLRWTNTLSFFIFFAKSTTFSVPAVFIRTASRSSASRRSVAAQWKTTDTLSIINFSSAAFKPRFSVFTSPWTGIIFLIALGWASLSRWNTWNKWNSRRKFYVHRIISLFRNIIRKTCIKLNNLNNNLRDGVSYCRRFISQRLYLFSKINTFLCKNLLVKQF